MSDDQSTPLRRDARGKRPTFYAQEGLDHAMSMILVLAQEHAVMRDRLDTLETVLAKKGVSTEDIEAHKPDQAELERREGRRQELFSRLYYLARKEVSELKEADDDARYTGTLDDIAKG